MASNLLRLLIALQLGVTFTVHVLQNQDAYLRPHLAEGNANALSKPADEPRGGGVRFANGELLPAVQCIYYLALNGSKELPLFREQMQSLGMWDRVRVHLSLPDPEGKSAGCWRAHVGAWNAALQEGCTHTLILEEDVYFEEAVVEAGFDHANAFLANGTAYDMLFLGYSPEVDARDGDKMAPFQHLSRMGGSVAETHDEFKCIYKLRRWLCTQAYVISHAAMYRWRNLTYDVQTNIPIDFFLSSEPGYSDSAYFTMMGFQRYHKPAVGVIESDTHTGSSYEVFKFIPGVVYSIIEPQLYSAKAKIISPAECLPPAQSYTWEGLSRNLFRILSSSLVSNADFCFPFAEALPAGAPQLPVIEIAPGFPNVTLPSGWPKSCLTLTDVLLQLSDAELPPLPFNATDLLERKQYFPKDSSGKV